MKKMSVRMISMVKMVTIKLFRKKKKKKSVFISLISDTFSIREPYIKLLFGTWRQNRGLLHLLHASTWYCSVSRNGAFLFGKPCFVKRNAYFTNMSLVLINFRDVSDILMSSFVSVLCIFFQPSVCGLS